MDDFFLQLFPRNFDACTPTTSGESNRATRADGKTACSLYVLVAIETYSHVFVENIF